MRGSIPDEEMKEMSIFCTEPGELGQLYILGFSQNAEI